MATFSSILAWEIPWTEEPGGLQSMGSQRVRHDLVTTQQQISECASSVFVNIIIIIFGEGVIIVLSTGLKGKVGWSGESNILLPEVCSFCHFYQQPAGGIKQF